MCLAIPGRVVRRTDNNMGLVDLGGVTKEISLIFLPDVVAGDWIILHTGFALERISEEDAMETISLLQEAFGQEKTCLSL
ncbi:MAG: HypC/HybG/HupF family hydrogenase formation chaperone [Candidatus Cloacimonadaceae bacterium]|nr:HypC/HybG/HupF family hydrogenase formation chaperone [Candidatus Cloacimonadaceae bacterium]MDP3113424.1 HypC/HybG/HupF family hydrogenase formation chaperone [Candidatus Cloacimonadaceae bacterium]